MNQFDESADPTERIATGRVGTPPVAALPGAPLQPGERVGDYRIVAVLGSGGMGEVYRAEQLQPVRRTVALKRLRRRRLNARQLGWFEIERQVLAQMQHPAVAQIFDAGTDDEGMPYFVMEFIDGQPLLRYCDNHALNLRQRIALLIEVCEGVQHAHQKGVIHRDLKPDNILVATVDGRPRPRIIDFGIATAEALGPGDGMPDLAGTPDYMSPEQAGHSSAAIDQRSDVYALGVILYELLTGRRPGSIAGTTSGRGTTLQPPSAALFEAADSRVVARRHGLSPQRLQRALRDDLDWVALKALAYLQNDRYPSVAVLADDLRRWLAGEPVAAAPGGRRYRFGKFMRRNRLALAAATVALAALVVGLGFSLYGLSHAETQRALAEARRGELEQVVTFQQNMLNAIDIEAMGIGLLELQRGRVAAALAEASDTSGSLAGYDAAVAAIAPADLARDLLDRYLLSGARAAIEREFAEQPALAADLNASTAAVYRAIGAYSPGIELLSAVRDARLGIAGPDALPALQAQLALAEVHGIAGNLDQALAMRQALHARVETLPDLPAQFRVAATIAYALSLSDTGRVDDALDIQQQTLADLVAARGESDPDAMAIRSHYAISLVRAGRPADARVEFERLLEVRRAVFGDDAVEVVSAMNNVAAIRSALLDHEGALEMQQRLYEKQRRRLGDEHHDTLLALANLALILNGLQRHDEAETMLRRVVELSPRVIGDDHPATLRNINNLAAVLVRTGKLAEAVTVQRDLVARRLAKLGPDHRETLLALRNMADMLGKAGEHEQAVELARSTLATMKLALGPQHETTIDGHLVLAESLINVGDPRGAIAVVSEAFALELPEHQRYELGMRLYRAQLAAGDTAEAATIRRDVFEPLLERDPETLSPRLQEVRGRVIKTLEDA